MTIAIDDELFSREARAGYDRARLDRGVGVLVGAGALGNNVAQTLALCGLGELRIIDFDHVARSNLTRAPLFRPERLRGARPRPKAHELALGFLAHAYATAPVVRAAAARV